MSAASKRWLSLIHRCDCVVCKSAYGVRKPAQEAHHIEHVRGDHSDFATAPLCKSCHDSLHGARRRPFYVAHKLDDVKLLALANQEVERILWETGQRIAA